MAFTEQEKIYNLALGMMGQTGITEGLTNQSQYIYCQRYYNDSLRVVLEGHYWNEATERSIILQDTTGPLFGFDYRYSKPSDCLRPINLGADIDYIDWREEGDYILTDYGRTPSQWATGQSYIAGQYYNLSDVTYLCNVSHTSATATSPATDTSTWTTTGGDYVVIDLSYIKLLSPEKMSAHLKMAVAEQLAIEVSSGLTGDINYKKYLQQEQNQIRLPQARTFDAQKGKPGKIFASSKWKRARL